MRPGRHQAYFAFGQGLAEGSDDPFGLRAEPVAAVAAAAEQPSWRSWHYNRLGPP